MYVVVPVAGLGADLRVRGVAPQKVLVSAFLGMPMCRQVIIHK
jgi:hypothetical protein